MKGRTRVSRDIQQGSGGRQQRGYWGFKTWSGRGWTRVGAGRAGGGDEM